MSHIVNAPIAPYAPTLSLANRRGILFQCGMVAAAVILPMAAHLAGAPVRLLLPMHWPVLLAAIVYGWRAGALTGLLAPVVNYLISGYPLPPILPSMTVELLAYGLVAGMMREGLKLNPYLSLALAVAAGRIVFIVSVIAGNVVPTAVWEYFRAALIPGITAAILQIFLLPLIARWWIQQERKKG